MNFKFVYNPFEKYSETRLLIWGMTVLFLFSLLGFCLHARFDGIIDMHIVESLTWYEPLIDNFLNTIVLFGVFFVFGKIINPKTRAIDILNASLIARIPIYLISLGNIGGTINKATQNILNQIDFDNLHNPHNPPKFEMLDLVITLFFAIFSIAMLVWMIALFWNGFRIATNTKGTRNVILFIVLFVLAYIISKVLVLNFNL